MPVSLDKSVKLNCAFQSGNPPFLRTRRLKFSVDPPSTGNAGSIYEPCRLRLNAAASSPQWLVSRWSPPTRNVRVTNHLCPHSRKVVYSHQAMATHSLSHFRLKLVQAILFFASNCRFQTQLVTKSFKNSNSSASLAQSKGSRSLL